MMIREASDSAPLLALSLGADRRATSDEHSGLPPTQKTVGVTGEFMKGVNSYENL